MPSALSRRSRPTAGATTPAAISSAARRRCPSRESCTADPTKDGRLRTVVLATADDRSLFGGRIGPGAGLFVRAAERVPIRERVPDLLGCRLGLRAQLGEIDAGNDGALHHNLAVDDDSIDVVADAALHDALDGIAHRSVAQRVAP